MPVWLFHASSAPVNLVSGSEDRYNKLIELGSTKAKLTTYSDEEMMAYELGKNSSFETHLSQILVADNKEMTDWLYTQTNAEVKAEEEQTEENKNNTPMMWTTGMIAGLILGAGLVFAKKQNK